MQHCAISSYLPLLSLWGIWCFLHSFLTSKWFSRIADRYFARFYRIYYNVFAAVTFLLIMHHERSLDRIVVYEFTGVWNTFRQGALVLSLFIFLLGAISYDIRRLLGISQLKSGLNHRGLTQTGQFSRSGILRMIRHPWYSAGFLLLWSHSRQWHDTTLLSSVVLSVYLLIGTFLEERKLAEQFGEAYSAYRKQVSMFIPIKWLKNRLTFFNRL